jgi:hypothetical protein
LRFSSNRIDDSPISSANRRPGPRRSKSGSNSSWIGHGLSGPEYRSTYEILLNLPDDLDDAWIDNVIGDWERIWANFFPAPKSSKRRVGELMQYTFAVLSGLAGNHLLQNRGARVRATGLELLKDTLVRELPGSDDAPS